MRGTWPGTDTRERRPGMAKTLAVQPSGTLIIKQLYQDQLDNHRQGTACPPEGITLRAVVGPVQDPVEPPAERPVQAHLRPVQWPGQ